MEEKAIARFTFADIFYQLQSPESEASSATPLVLLHGVMGYSSNWAGFWPFFKDRPVLAVDHRGHGKSKKPASGYTPEDYAKDLKEVLDHLSWDKIHLMGHSMGAKVGLSFSSFYPSYLESLTLEDPSFSNYMGPWGPVAILSSIPAPFSNAEEAKDFLWKKKFQDTATRDFLYSNLRRQENGTYDWQFSKSGILESVKEFANVDYPKMLSKLDLPILIVRGQKSLFLKREDAEKVKSLNSRVEMYVVEGAGHVVHFTHAKELAQIVKNFFVSNKLN